MKQSIRLSTIALISANLYPVYAVLIHDMPVFSLIILFIFETLVIEIFTVFKMLKLNNFDKWEFGNIPLFIIGYTVFFAAQLGFFLLISGIWLAHIKSEHNIWYFFSHAQIWESLLFLLSSHGFSFYFNYIRKKEYLKTTLSELMMMPYRRVLIQQTIVIGGGILLGTIQSSAAFLIVLIASKIIFDLKAHISEHKKQQLA